jgi:hypothetical protein
MCERKVLDRRRGCHHRDRGRDLHRASTRQLLHRQRAERRPHLSVARHRQRIGMLRACRHERRDGRARALEMGRQEREHLRRHRPEVAVAALAVDQLHGVRRAEQAEEALRFVERVLGASDREEVGFERDDRDRARGGQLHPVGEVEARRDEARPRLLGVLRTVARHQRLERRDERRDRGGLDPGIHGREIRRGGATAGAAEGPDARRIDVGALRQVVDAADAVGEPVPCDVLADEQRGLVGVLVLAAGLDLRRAQLGVEVLQALALAHRIDGQRQKPGAREVRRPRILAGLAGAVSGCDDERRERAVAGRDVDVGGHPVAGDTLEGDVLDPEAVVVDGGEAFRDDGTRGRPWDAADEIDDGLPHFALAPLGVGAGGDRRDRRDALVELRETNRVEVGDERGLRGSRLRGGLVLGASGGSRASRCLGGQRDGGRSQHERAEDDARESDRHG